MRRHTALWALAALLGLMLAAGISWATSTLTSQHIGLASEAVTAGRRLAPPEATRSTPATTPAKKPATTQPSTSTRTTTPPTTTAPAEAETAPAGETTAPQTTRQGTAPGRDDSSGSAGGGQGRDD